MTKNDESRWPMTDPLASPTPPSAETAPRLTEDQMTTIREKAEQAMTRGPWYHDPDPRDDGADQIIYRAENGRVLTLCFMATGRGDDDIDRDAAYIAAVSPDVVLALLARIAELEKDVAFHADCRPKLVAGARTAVR